MGEWALVETLRINAIPKPQPRIKARRIGDHAGVYTPQTAKNWKEAVMFAASQYHLQDYRLEGPLSLAIVFYMPRPKAHRGNTYVVVKPDIDNLLKSTLDALTDLGVWHDDSQIAAIDCSKVYENGNNAPGAIISIFALV